MVHYDNSSGVSQCKATNRNESITIIRGPPGGTYNTGYTPSGGAWWFNKLVLHKDKFKKFQIYSKTVEFTDYFDTKWEI